MIIKIAILGMIETVDLMMIGYNFARNPKIQKSINTNHVK